MISIENQSLFDIAVQAYGSCTAVVGLALENDRSITDTLIVGSILFIGESAYTDADILGYYQQKNIHPATAITATIEKPTAKGIGVMTIQDNIKPFIVR